MLEMLLNNLLMYINPEYITDIIGSAKGWLIILLGDVEYIILFIINIE